MMVTGNVLTDRSHRYSNGVAAVLTFTSTWQVVIR